MTLQDRIRLLAPVTETMTDLGAPRQVDLEELVCAEVGSLSVLDDWVMRRGSCQQTRALPPRRILHVLAGNLAVSGRMSILAGLLLGSQNVVKLPAEGDREIVSFVEGLPGELLQMVKLIRDVEDAVLEEADAVIVYGRDETIEAFRKRVRFDQTFLGYSHRASLIWLGSVKETTSDLAAACAYDVSLYDQRGCLSPQSIYLETGSKMINFCDQLSAALEEQARRMPPDAEANSFEAVAQIEEARNVAVALGERVWSSAPSTSWTIILTQVSLPRHIPLNRVVHVHEITTSKLEIALDPLRGKLSTVGTSGPLESKVETAFLALGVNRFCPVGRMQHPHISWHHDGRPVLSDLVKWVDRESGN